MTRISIIDANDETKTHRLSQRDMEVGTLEVRRRNKVEFGVITRRRPNVQAHGRALDQRAKTDLEKWISKARQSLNCAAPSRARQSDACHKVHHDDLPRLLRLETPPPYADLQLWPAPDSVEAWNSLEAIEEQREGDEERYVTPLTPPTTDALRTKSAASHAPSPLAREILGTGMIRRVAGPLRTQSIELRRLESSPQKLWTEEERPGFEAVVTDENKPSFYPVGLEG
ncbi:hypothetical protein R3P38DRAFT_2767178 [Favolaschia claudopus]|uniref:Uncharacterized protein n=1 Tax=Favolaschia claudopus TaxID=2862362 RepID=A0AAW0CYD5_9AGAR